MTAIEKNYILLSIKCATNESREPANDNIRQIVQNNSSKVCEWDCVVRRLRRWTLDKCCWHWGRTELPGSDKKYKAGYCTVRRIRWAAQGRRSHIWTQCITNQLTKKCKSIKTNVRCTTSKNRSQILSALTRNVSNICMCDICNQSGKLCHWS